ncbi:hypothetical protein [Haloarcula sp. Atlit-47R]|uniref:hypothetical protein n=1 Tax=Haloarcula sp. Atlit-47R TaxID=2282132 RepID=UPI0011C3BD27|nr:hypothetical protein [Haloarcula sp. Atlit-47R]
MPLMVSNSSNSVNKLFQYPQSEFGQPTDSVFMICEIGDEIYTMVNDSSTYSETLISALDYLERALEAVSLLPAVNEFHPTELFGKLIINIREFGLDLMLTYPGFLLLTLLVYKLKDRFFTYKTGRTPRPSSSESWDL